MIFLHFDRFILFVFLFLYAVSTHKGASAVTCVINKGYEHVLTDTVRI